MRDRHEDRDEIVAACLDRLNSGEDLDPMEILEKHPDIGGEILEELRTFLDLGGASGTEKAEEPLGTLGDYTLRRQIGRGGMGVVYEAWQVSVDRQVALKVLPGAVAADDRSFSRFMREARAAGKLNHPNIVGVYSMGQEDHTPYYAMEGRPVQRIL